MRWRQVLEDARIGAIILLLILATGLVMILLITRAPVTAFDWAARSVGIDDGQALAVVLLAVGVISTAVFWGEKLRR